MSNGAVVRWWKMVRPGKRIAAFAFLCVSACTNTVSATLAKHSVVEASEVPADRRYLKDLATRADGLVRVQLKFPRDVDLARPPESSIRAVVELSYCKRHPDDREYAGMPSSWVSYAGDLITDQPQSGDTLEIFLPRTLGNLINSDPRKPVEKWPDQAIEENELCLDIWTAFYWWKPLQITRQKLGRSSGFQTSELATVR